MDNRQGTCDCVVWLVQLWGIISLSTECDSHYYLVFCIIHYPEIYAKNCNKLKFRWYDKKKSPTQCQIIIINLLFPQNRKYIWYLVLATKYQFSIHVWFVLFWNGNRRECCCLSGNLWFFKCKEEIYFTAKWKRQDCWFVTKVYISVTFFSGMV